MALASKHFLPYPNMERQDLTQGQLGSFKFTPVDAVQKDINNEYLATMLQQEMVATHHLSAQNTVALALQPAQAASSDKSALSRAATAVNTPSGPAFFDDLTLSRLKYGPAAVRSAVQFYSPENSRRPVSDFDLTGLACPSSDSQQRSSFNSSFVVASSAAEMNPSVSNFLPFGPAQDSGGSEVNNVILALGRSLDSEQQAHQETKTHLQNAQFILSTTEQELNRVMQRNNSLKATIDMLSAIIANNQPGVNDLVPSNTAVHNKSVDNNQDAGVNNNSPIIHDVLAQRLTEYDQTNTEKDATPSNAESVCIITEAENPAQAGRPDDSQLFNFDLLNTPPDENSPDAILRRSLRRHFEVPSGAEEGRLGRVVTPPARRLDTGLPSVSPQAIDRGPRAQISSVLMATKKLQQQTTAPPPPRRAPAQLDEAPMMNRATHEWRAGEQTNNVLSSQAVTTLPAAFLAKYKPPTRLSRPGAAVADATARTTSEADANITAEATTSSSGTVPSTINTVVAGAPPITRSTNTDPRTLSPISLGKYMVSSTFDLTIMWKVHRLNPIFNSDAEKIDRIGELDKPVNKQNKFWEHPVRYLEQVEHNIFRTVMIDYIPAEATIEEVVSQVRGGSLESINMFGPIGRGKVTPYQTARIVFNTERGASLTNFYHREYPMTIRDRLVRVWKIPTATWPKSKALEKLVFDHNATRVLAMILENEADYDLPGVPRMLGRLEKSIITKGRTKDGLPMIEFKSIVDADQAMEILVSVPELEGAHICYAADPCDGCYPRNDFFGGDKGVVEEKTD